MVVSVSKSEFVSRLVGKRVLIFACCFAGALVVHALIPQFRAYGVVLPEWIGIAVFIGIYCLFVLYVALFDAPRSPRS